MKRIIKFCLLILVSFLLISYGKEAINNKQSQNKTISPSLSQQVSTEKPVQVNNSGVYGIYDMTGEFVNKVTNNPIDHDYQVEFKELSQSKTFSTNTEMALESKYTKIWDVELNAIYNILLAKLTPKEKEGLIETQQGWLQYHMKESEFVNQVFNLRESGPVLGSQGTIQKQQAIKERIRERTLELMEYCSLLGDNVEFVYGDFKK